MTTANLQLNGARKYFDVAIVGLPPTSLASRLCLQVNGLMQKVEAKKTGIKTAKGGLTTLTEFAVNSASVITDPIERKEILTAFGGAWHKLYDKKRIDRLVHENTGDNPYASLIGAFTDHAKVSGATQDFVLAAASLDKKHGRHADTPFK